MFVAVAAFSLMDALLKLFAAHYPPIQVTAIRALASLPFLLVPLWYRGRLAELRPQRIGLHLLRGALGILMLVTFIMALRDASLSSVYSLYMSAPLLIAVLAALLLKEKVDVGRWLAIVVGLIGVLIILQPRPDGLPLLAGLTAALSALCYAFAAITARILTRSEKSPAIVFTFLLIIALVAGAIAMPNWIPHPRHRLVVDRGCGRFRRRGPALHHRGVPSCARCRRGTGRVHGLALGYRNRLGSVVVVAEQHRARRCRARHRRRYLRRVARAAPVSCES